VESSWELASTLGAQLRITFPVEPPMPKLDIAIMGRPEREPSGAESDSTCTRQDSQSIAGFKRCIARFGGITRFLSIRHALTKDARKAVLSRWLENLG
jgi:hypothetical protein